MIVSALGCATHFQIHGEVKRMARRGGRVLLLMLLAALLSAAQARAQSARPAAATPAAPVNPPQLETDAILWLQALIRINTTNPPGNELAAAKYIASILEKDGIHSETFESTPGRGFLVARLSSSAMPDPSKALLLMGHLDVVGVDKTKWTVDPFGGVIKDNYLYGRGSIDDKGMTIANLAVFVALKRSGARLNRDVIFLAEGDEEAGGQVGMKFAVEKHWDKIASGFALNECGRTVMKNGKVQYVAVQVSEKVAVNVNVIATGTSGHGSVPLKDNAVTHLSAAMAKLGTYEAPVQFNSVTRGYFEGIAPLQDGETSKWMLALESSDRADHAARWLSNANPIWNAMLRDTVNPTMLQAGIRANVVPSEARGVLNVRLLPGNMATPLLSKLTQLVNDPQVRLEPQAGAGETAPSSSLETDLYATIKKVTAQEFSGAPVVPYMSTQLTDSAPLSTRTVQAYGFDPFPLTEEDVMRMHADDERIPVESFRKGVQFLSAVVEAFAVTK